MKRFKEKNVLVYGLSSSGEWVSKLLLKEKANVFLFDDDKEVLKNKKIKGCYILTELNENYINELDYVIVSPSIEKTNSNLVLMKSLGKTIFSEVEFASFFAGKFIAVTGTNGKTTTVNLISVILNKKKPAIACGNVGYPLSKAVIKNKNAIKVVEVSSFMLENAYSFCPSVATLLNISPDHLVRHKTMDEYKNLKLSLFKNLTRKDYAIINLDEKIQPTVSAKTITYSYDHYADVYVKDGYIYLHKDRVVAINELSLKGRHNVYNVMCAICVGFLYNVKIEKMRSALISFKGDRHRIETVGVVNDITFINDSKSTNISSTLACVDCFKAPIRLLLGGSNKDLDYTKLFSKLSKKVKYIYAFGEIKDSLVASNKNKFPIKTGKCMQEAFDLATKDSLSGDYVVLSPATASFDEFNNYIERGERFNQMVKEYENSFKEE